MSRSVQLTPALAVALLLTMALSGCGGGGGGVRPPPPPPEVSLPPGHGLGVGEIVVAAGATAEHGNVAVTCPAGGGACVISVMADGTAEYDRTGGVPTVAAAYAGWDLPMGHGLGTGEIVVAAGATAEHGNVAVTCPGGGGACVISVMADGTAEYARTGGVPTVAAAYAAWGLPAGHGVGAGEIVVAAGATAEHGNVVVTCPGGGGACVISVMADGTAEYARTGGVPTVMAAYAAWDLPMGHGLGAGEIVVAAGATAEHGNVVVTCPAGGGACVISVMADGTAEYARTGGVPTVAVGYAGWDLPMGHGLGAGEIVVVAGTSVEHGNVVVTCPGGGGACVISVMADGTAEYDRTGGVPTVAAAYAAWGLPMGHGLGTGEIVVAAGATAEHGNVVVTCPGGGGACVISVMADGTAEYARTGGVPTVAATYAAWGLPAGHGVEAGEIVVAAGATAEHGNVVVTCPGGGGACVINVMADGTAEYARTGGVPTVMAAYAAWGLPAGHGLGASEIVVAAGATAEHGNVVVTCPGGGGACVISVMADGTAEYARTGGVPTVMAAYAAWDLPMGHGLGTGEIVVAAGATAEHGNVVVTCPGGGGACVISVMADGTAEYARTGGVPTVMAAYAAWDLPAGHGVGAGEIVVVAGATAEHGNVVVTCATGGSACVVRVMADGTAEYARTGGMPTVTSAYAASALPAGHGLGAGEITVAAGESAEHGNVVVTCPGGGGACVISVMADGTAEYARTGGVPTVMAAYAAWALPLGHGLGAGEITVAAGESAEHGNVVVTCPAGGSACVISLSADGTAAYARTGGIPTFMFANRSYERNNPTAEDLLDHWNQPDALRTALSLSAVAPSDVGHRKDVLARLIHGAGGKPDETGTLLRNVRPEDIEIIGERNGITYGRWKGGPAGTLNIEFDWRFAKDFDDETRARMERAGKSWSWRIMDDFGTHTVRDGTVVRRRIFPGTETLAVTYDEDVTVDGILIVMMAPGATGFSNAGYARADVTQDDITPWLGALMLSSNHVHLTGLMAHEIGHVLGLMETPAPSVERYTNRNNQTFTGPESQRANGGRPVPFQWLDSDFRPVAPNTPGASVDYTHPGVCASIMAYCADSRETFRPAPIDFAMLDDIGYDILDAEDASEPELYGYGAWGEYSAWGAGVERFIQYQGGRIVTAGDILRAGADAFGIAPGVGLAESPAALQGDVTWSGSLVGVDLGQPMLPPVFGNAELEVNLSTLQGTAVFDGLAVHVDGGSSAFRQRELQYAIGVTGNSFSDLNAHVRGGFFGPGHEEMAGVLDDRTATVNLLAGFGGQR